MRIDVNPEWAESLSSQPRKTYGYYLVKWMVSQCGPTGLFKEGTVTQQEIEAALFAAVRVEFKVFASGGAETFSVTLQGQSIEDLRRKIHLWGELMKLKSLLAE